MKFKKWMLLIPILPYVLGWSQGSADANCAFVIYLIIAILTIFTLQVKVRAFELNLAEYEASQAKDGSKG